MFIVLLTVNVNAQYRFLDADFSSELPKGWVIETNKSGDNWKAIDGQLRFEGEIRGSFVSVTSPVVNLKEAVEPIIEFGYLNEQFDGLLNKFEAYYRVSPDSAWILLLSTEQREKRVKDFSLTIADSLKTEQFQLKFEVANNFGAFTSIDYIRIVEDNVCISAPTNLDLTDVSESTAMLAWNTDSVAVNTRIVVATKLFESEKDIDASAVIFDSTMVASRLINTAKVGNLVGGTTYYVYVQADCAYGDLSPWSSISFVTPCKAIPTPFKDNFENGLGCWQIKTSGTYAPKFDTEVYNSEKNSVYFYTAKNNFLYAYTPEFDVEDIRKMALTMKVYSDKVGTTYASEIVVGVLTNPADESTFAPVHVIAPTEKSTWQTIEVTFRDYEGDAYGNFGKYIAFRAGNADKANYIWIDDVELDIAGCYAPQMVTIEEVTARTATLSWTEMGTSTKWNVKVATDTLDSAALLLPAMYDVVVDTPVVTIPNLEPNNKYYVYVQSECGAWADVVEVETKKVWKVGYTDNFNSYGSIMPDDWVYGYVVQSTGALGTSSTYMPKLNTVAGNNNSSLETSALGALYFNHTTSNNPFCIFSEVDVERIQDIQFTFYAKMASLTEGMVVAVCSSQDINNAEITPIDTIYPNTANKYERHIITFDKYQGNGKYIAISAKLDVKAKSTNGCYFDDFSIDSLSHCNTPQGVEVSGISVDGATLSWNPVAASKWNVQLFTAEKTASSVAVVDTIVENPYCEIKGLANGTTYYAYVAAIEGENMSEYTLPFTFTTVYVMTVPYYNDFTSEPTGSGKHPVGWVVFNELSTSNTYKPYGYNTNWSFDKSYTAPSDLKKPSLYFNAANSSSTKAYRAYAVMPAIADTININELYLSCYLHYNSTSTTAIKDLEVGIMLDPNDPTTFQLVDVMQVETPKIPQSCYVSFAGYKGDGRMIAFRTPNEKAVSLYLDNLRVGYILECAQVSQLETAELTDSSAVITWLNGNKEAQWNVKVFDHQVFPADLLTEKGNVLDTTTTEKPLKLPDLDYNTSYWVAIQAKTANCVGDWSSVFEFKTECPAQYTVPYLETFNDMDKDMLLDCFLAKGQASGYVAKTCANSISYPDFENGYKDNSSTGNTLKFYADDVYYSYLIFPEFDRPINELQLSFQALGYGKSDPAYVEIGVMEDIDSTFLDPAVYTKDLPTNDSLFTSIMRFDLETPGTKTWEYCMVQFDSYTGKGKRIALRAGGHKERLNTSTENKVLLDHFKVETLPTCTKIIDAAISAIGTDNATLTWSARSEQHWNLKVADSELSPEKEIGWIVDTEITTCPYTITGLKPNTRYYAYVQRVNKTENCVGDWSEVVAFNTNCAPTTTSFFDNFESNLERYGSGIAPRCWTIVGTDPKGSYVDVLTAGGGMGKKPVKGDSLVFVLYNTSTYKNDANVSYTSYAVLPELALDSVEQVQIRFKAYRRLSSGGQFEVGVMTDPTDASTYRAVYADTIPADPNLLNVWHEYTVNFLNYTCDDYGDVGKHIVLRAMPGQSTTNSDRLSTNTIYIDSLYVEPYQYCAKPMSLAVDEVDADYVKLSWKGNGNKFRVLVGRSNNFDEHSAIVDTIVTSLNPTIEGLPMSAYLGAKVQMLCDEGGSDWTDVVMFRTLGCNAQLPYIESFEGIDAGKVIPDCWNGYNAYSTIGYGSGGDNAYYNSSSYGGGQPYIYASAYITTANPATGKKSLGIGSNTSYNGYAILPKLNITDYSQITMSFSAYLYSSNKIEVGIIEDVKDITTYRPLKIFSATSNLPRVDALINFADYADVMTPKHRIVLRGLGNTSTEGLIFVDDIIVNYTNDALWAPSDISILDVTHNSATVKWAKVGVVDEFEVAVVLADSAITSETTIYKTTDAQIALNDLASNTKYDAYVRSRKGTEYSAWTNPCMFYVYYKPDTLPYSTNFNNLEDNAKWHLRSTATNGTLCVNQWIFGSDVYYGTSDNMALYISNDSSTWAYTHAGSNDNSYAWAHRTFKVEKAGFYDIALMAQSEAYEGSTNDYLSVSFVPASYALSAGSTCKDVYTNSNLSHSSSNVIPKKFTANVWTKVESKVYVEEPGYYTLYCYWNNYSGNVYNHKPAAIDSLSIKEATCAAAFDLAVTAVYDTVATVTWKGIETLDWRVIVSTHDVDDAATIDSNLVLLDTVLEQMSIDLTLAPSNHYYVYVRPTCEEITTWEQIEVATMCQAKALPYVETFGEKTSTQIDCWQTTAGATISSTSFGNSEIAVQFSNSKAIVMPLFGVDIKDLQITFQAAHSASNTAPTDFEMGVMTNPFDMTTYEKLMTARTTGIFNTASKAVWSDYYYNFANYAGEARYIVFTATQGTFYLNHVEVELTPECAQPFNLVASAITSSSAKVRWETVEGQDKWVVKAVTEAMDEAKLDTTVNVLFADTVSTAGVVLENLTPSTNVYVYVKSLCAAEGEWSLPLVVTTAEKPLPMPFIETFTGFETGELPMSWIRYNDVIYDEFLAGNEQLKEMEPSSSLYNVFAVQEKTDATNAEVRFFDNSPVLHSVLNALLGDSYGRWAVSPEVYIDQKALLSFDLLLEKQPRYNFNGKAVTENRESHIRVLISTDNGQTWPKSQSILISDAKSADYKLDQFIENWDRISIDLSAYVGKNIRFAFYAEAADRAELYCYFDNIKVKCATVYDYADAAFEKRDYAGYGFEIDYSELTPGVKSYTRLAENADAEGCDSIVNISLDVQPMLRNNISDLMCPDDMVYVENGFSVSEPGVYRQRHIVASGADSIVTLTLGVFEGETEFAISKTIKEGEFFSFGGKNLTETGVYTDSLVNQYGCDSVITLNLVVISSSREVVFDTICFGTKYSWNGKEYDQTGIYVDTLKSVVTGGDSIVTLMLTVNDAITSTATVEICFGASYQFGDTIITVSGEYIETFVAANGCDSIVTLNAVVLPDYRQTYNEVICEGEAFTGYGFNNVTTAGTHTLDLQSVTGCDSTITLKLTVLSGDTTRVEDTITTADLPYEYQGKVYPEGTAAGVYVDTIFVSNENCDNVIILTLTIEEIVDVDNLRISDLIMVPNPVAIGEELYVGAEFTSEELEDMIVEVFNVTGQCVYRLESAQHSMVNSQFVITGLPQAGVYMVNITTATGSRYHGKVIVK